MRLNTLHTVVLGFYLVYKYCSRREYRLALTVPLAIRGFTEALLITLLSTTFDISNYSFAWQSFTILITAIIVGITLTIQNGYKMSKRIDTWEMNIKDAVVWIGLAGLALLVWVYNILPADWTNFVLWRIVIFWVSTHVWLIIIAFYEIGRVKKEEKMRPEIPEYEKNDLMMAKVGYESSQKCKMHHIAINVGIFVLCAVFFAGYFIITANTFEDYEVQRNLGLISNGILILACFGYGWYLNNKKDN